MLGADVNDCGRNWLTIAYLAVNCAHVNLPLGRSFRDPKVSLGHHGLAGDLSDVRVK